MSAGTFFYFVKYGRKFRAILMSLLEKSCLNCPAIGWHPWSKSLLQFYWSLIKTSGNDKVHQTCGLICLIITDCFLLAEW